MYTHDRNISSKRDFKNFIIQEKYVIIAVIIYVSKQNSELD